MGQVASKWCSFLASTTYKRFPCCRVLIDWYLYHPRSMASSLRWETKLLVIFSHQTQHFLHFLGMLYFRWLFHAWYGYGIDGQAQVSPTASAHPLKDCNPSFHYLLMNTAHDDPHGSLLFHRRLKRRSRPPESAKDFDFTLNLIALRAITAS